MRQNILTFFFLPLFACTSEYSLRAPVEKVWVGGVPSELTPSNTEETYLQEAPRPIDIVFVVDQSCSMINNTYQLTLSIPDFFETMNAYNLDYRVGVISTEGFNHFAGELTWYGDIQYITPRTPDQQSAFSFMSSRALGYGEAGLAAVTHSLTSAYEENQEFYRVGVPLAYIVISDEADQSQYVYDSGQPVVGPRLLASFLNWLEPYKQGPITFSAIAGNPKRICESVLSADNRYKKTTELTHGMFYNICDDDWSAVLKDFAHYAVPQIYEYFLAQIPIEESIEVTVEREGITLIYEAEIDWYYDDIRNSITFYEYQHEAGDIVRIKYHLDGSYE